MHGHFSGFAEKSGYGGIWFTVWEDLVQEAEEEEGVKSSADLTLLCVCDHRCDHGTFAFCMLDMGFDFSVFKEQGG